MNTKQLKELAIPFTESDWFVNKDEEVVVIDPEVERDDSGEIFVACANSLKTAIFIAAANPCAVLALIEKLEAAERERDELRDDVKAYSEHLQYHINRQCKAEAELARRDAAAGEPVAWQYRYNDGKVGDWKTVDSESECNHSTCYERRAIYTAATPTVLPDIEPLIEGALKLHGLRTAADGHSQLSDGFRNGARWAAKELGAQPQKPVVLPFLDVGIKHVFGIDAYRADDVLAALDAANIPYEMKK